MKTPKKGRLWTFVFFQQAWESCIWETNKKLWQKVPSNTCLFAKKDRWSQKDNYHIQTTQKSIPHVPPLDLFAIWCSLWLWDVWKKPIKIVSSGCKQNQQQVCKAVRKVKCENGMVFNLFALSDIVLPNSKQKHQTKSMNLHNQSRLRWRVVEKTECWWQMKTMAILPPLKMSVIMKRCKNWAEAKKNKQKKGPERHEQHQ